MCLETSYTCAFKGSTLVRVAPDADRGVCGLPWFVAAARQIAGVWRSYGGATVVGLICDHPYQQKGVEDRI
jgi:hypothetical protein